MYPVSYVQLRDEGYTKSQIPDWIARPDGPAPSDLPEEAPEVTLAVDEELELIALLLSCPP